MLQLLSHLLTKQSYLAPLVAAGVVLFVVIGAGLLLLLAPRITHRSEQEEGITPEAEGGEKEPTPALPAAREREALSTGERAALPPPKEN